MRKVRVLIIDDSAHNRQAIADMLDGHPEIEVIGRAFDGEEGLKLVTTLHPDLVTLDIEMPRMDGFTFLRLLMHQMPTPVIVISSHSRKDEVFQALELGALDFIAKPAHHIGPELATLRDDLVSKVLTVRDLEPAALGRRPAEPSAMATAVPRPGLGPDGRGVLRLVCIGASTGGPPALESVFRALPIYENTAFLVVQHMPEKFTRAFAERLNRMVAMEIREAGDGMLILPGSAYVAPGGVHLEIGSVGERGFVTRLHGAEPSDRYVPSIDRLFSAAAHHFRCGTMAVVLTGMGADGSKGVRAVHQGGGVTLAESRETAIVYGMPREAIATGCVDQALALPGLIEQIHAFATAGPRRAGDA